MPFQLEIIGPGTPLYAALSSLFPFHVAVDGAGVVQRVSHHALSQLVMIRPASLESSAPLPPPRSSRLVPPWRASSDGSALLVASPSAISLSLARRSVACWRRTLPAPNRPLLTEACHRIRAGGEQGTKVVQSRLEAH